MIYLCGFVQLHVLSLLGAFAFVSRAYWSISITSGCADTLRSRGVDGICPAMNMECLRSAHDGNDDSITNTGQGSGAFLQADN